MSTKRTQFFDGFQSETTPNTVVVSAEGVIGEWKGAWTAIDYIVNDAVYFEGSGYICIQDTTAQQDPTNGAYWQVVVLKGETLDIDEANVDLTEAKISTIEAMGGITPLDRYMITIDSDLRANQALPVELTGDKKLHLLTWDGSVWKDHGQFVGADASGQATREIPTGVVNGINTIFTLTNPPTSDQHIQVFVDGNFLYDNEFSLVGNTLTLVTAPSLGQTLFAWYSYGGAPVAVTGSEVLAYHAVTTGEEASKQFTLPSLPADTTKVLVDIIGGTSQQYLVDFTISGTTFDWNGLGLDGQLIENDVVRLKYFS